MIDNEGQAQMLDFDSKVEATIIDLNRVGRKVERRRWTCSACGRNVSQGAGVCPNGWCKTVFVN